jgi:adenylate kinase
MVHEPSGRIYNMTWNPPKVPGFDDATGEQLTRRPDDSPVDTLVISSTFFPTTIANFVFSNSKEIYAKRLKQYEETTEPLLEHYDKAGILWTVSGKSSDEITPQLDAEILRRFS